MPQNMASFDRVLLIGASGLLGKAIQNALLMNKGKFEKLGVLTSSSALPNPSKDEYWASLRARGVEIIKVDFGDNDALVKAFSGNTPCYPNLRIVGMLSNFRRMGCGY